MTKKSTVLIGCLLTFCLQSAVAFQHNDLAKKNLKGKVEKTISHYYEPILNGEGIEKGEKKNTFIYAYNEDGNEVLYDGGHYQTISEYNEKGFKNRLYLTDGDKIYQSVEIVVDSNGQRRSEVIYDIRKNILGKRTYRKKENQVEMTEFGHTNDTIPKEVIIYDQQENKIHKEKYNPQGDKLLSIDYMYDGSGRVVRESQFNFKPWTLFTETKFQYNENGDVSYKRTLSSQNTEEFKYDYVYDSERNWIKRIKYQDKKAIEIQEREIVYFD
ncbi:hypothetical protein MTsPCn5_05170 [Croceitalea sp. MTPC5]|uniref:hypothetical protein n=1 Tax=Croceitalea sp. MTPC5 TaxID=3056565 RepID=UPI002B3BDF9E|nr:hypothetical protein MTsPCn5_05170 [Croceitalea sp. MTPC5]